HRRLVAVGRRHHPLPRDPRLGLARVSRYARRSRTGHRAGQMEDRGADRRDLHPLYRLRLSPRRGRPPDDRRGVERDPEKWKPVFRYDHAATKRLAMRLLYFAWVKEKVGRASEDIALPPEIATIAELIAWLKTRGPEFANAFARDEIIRAAIDQSHVRHDARIGTAREIAFFPPVTGG